MEHDSQRTASKKATIGMRKLLVISRPVAAKIKQQDWLFFLSFRETNLRICQASEVITFHNKPRKRSKLVLILRR
jgi:hypothetical protein